MLVTEARVLAGKEQILVLYSYDFECSVYLVINWKYFFDQNDKLILCIMEL